MKTTIALLVSLGIVGTANAALNLKERNVKTEQQANVDKATAQFKDACGCAPKVTVDWEAVANSTTKAEYREQAMEEAPKCMEQLAYAVGDVGNLCKTNKAEICKGIKTVNITFNGKDKKPWTKLEGGKLTLSVSGGGEGCDGAGAMQGVLEKAL